MSAGLISRSVACVKYKNFWQSCKRKINYFNILNILWILSKQWNEKKKWYRYADVNRLFFFYFTVYVYSIYTVYFISHWLWVCVCVCGISSGTSCKSLWIYLKAKYNKYCKIQLSNIFFFKKRKANGNGCVYHNELCISSL